jgi:hypothetical protein
MPILPAPPVAEGESPVVVAEGLSEPVVKGSSELLVADGNAGLWVEAVGSGLSSSLSGFKTLHHPSATSQQQ